VGVGRTAAVRVTAGASGCRRKSVRKDKGASIPVGGPRAYGLLWEMNRLFPANLEWFYRAKMVTKVVRGGA
jgi:hypothetical protein